MLLRETGPEKANKKLKDNPVIEEKEDEDEEYDEMEGLEDADEAKLWEGDHVGADNAGKQADEAVGE